MKLKDYIKMLSKMTEQDSSLLECEVVYEDHESNIKVVDTNPMIGHFTSGHFYAWSPVPYIEKRPTNAVRLV
jgi:hypothetical protein